jgi:hypothetical protein
MVMNRQTQEAAAAAAKLFESMTGFPSPEKLLLELQRFNNNMEVLQPDIHKLATAMESLKADDIRNFTAAINNVKSGDLMRLMNEFCTLMSNFYQKLWGKT